MFLIVLLMFPSSDVKSYGSVGSDVYTTGKGKVLFYNVTDDSYSTEKLSGFNNAVLNVRLLREETFGVQYTPSCLTECHMPLRIITDFPVSIDDNNFVHRLGLGDLRFENFEYLVLVDVQKIVGEWVLVEKRKIVHKDWNGSWFEPELERMWKEKIVNVKEWKKLSDVKPIILQPREEYFFDIVAKKRGEVGSKSVDVIPEILGIDFSAYAYFNTSWQAKYKIVLNNTDTKAHRNESIFLSIKDTKCFADPDGTRVVFNDTTETDFEWFNSSKESLYYIHPGNISANTVDDFSSLYCANLTTVLVMNKTIFNLSRGHFDGDVAGVGLSQGWKLDSGSNGVVNNTYFRRGLRSYSSSPNGAYFYTPGSVLNNFSFVFWFTHTKAPSSECCSPVQLQDNASGIAFSFGAVNSLFQYRDGATWKPTGCSNQTGDWCLVKVNGNVATNTFSIEVNETLVNGNAVFRNSVTTIGKVIISASVTGTVEGNVVNNFDQVLGVSGRDLNMYLNPTNASLSVVNDIKAPTTITSNNSFFSNNDTVTLVWFNANSTDSTDRINYSVQVFNDTSFSFLLYENHTVNETGFGGVNRTNVTLTNVSSDSCINGCFWRVKAVVGNAVPQVNSSYSIPNMTFIVDDRLPNNIQYQGFTLSNDSYSRFDWVFVNVSVREDWVANATFKIFNVTGEINSTNVSTSSNNSIALNVSNVFGRNVAYEYNMTVYDNASNRNVSFTRRVTRDIELPFVDLFTPNSSFSSVDNIRLNFTASDNFVLSTCWFNISNLAGNFITPVGGNESINYVGCGANTSFSLDNGGNYFIYISANDSAGNMNTSNKAFSVSSQSGTPTGGGAGGGAGGGSTQIIKVGCAKEFFTIDKQQQGISIVTVPGGKRSDSFNIINQGTEDVIVKLSVEDFNGTGKDWVVLDSGFVNLQPNKRKSNLVPVGFSIPLDAKKGNYYFQVRVVGSAVGCQLLSIPVPVEIQVRGFYGAFSDFVFEKVLGGVRNVLIFIGSLLFLVVGLLILMFAVGDKVFKNFNERTTLQGFLFLGIVAFSLGVSFFTVSIFA